MKHFHLAADIVVVADRASCHDHRGSSWERLGRRVGKQGTHPGADIRSQEPHSLAGRMG